MRLFPLAQRQFRLRRRTWLAAGGALLLLLLFFEVVGENGYWSRREQRHQIGQLQSEIELLQQENQQLTQRIQELRSDPQAIEKMAREQLRLARPGEVIITLPRTDPGHPSSGLAQSIN